MIDRPGETNDTIEVELLFFAGARERAGASSVRLRLPENSCVRDLVARLSEDYAALRDLLPSCRIAVNSTYVDEDERLSDGCKCALIPPVSGG